MKRECRLVLKRQTASFSPSSNFFPKLSAISPLTMGLTGHTQWNVVNPVRDENAELKLIVKDYMRCGYKKRSTLEAMIGLKKSALDERIGSLKKL